jgi:hypothetical protein
MLGEDSLLPLDGRLHNATLEYDEKHYYIALLYCRSIAYRSSSSTVRIALLCTEIRNLRYTI